MLLREFVAAVDSYTSCRLISQEIAPTCSIYRSRPKGRLWGWWGVEVVVAVVVMMTMVVVVVAGCGGDGGNGDNDLDGVGGGD